MMPKLNIENAIKNGRQLLNNREYNRYDIGLNDIIDIIDMSESEPIIIGANCFQMGFYQGFKAAKKLHTHTHTHTRAQISLIQAVYTNRKAAA